MQTPHVQILLKKRSRFTPQLDCSLKILSNWSLVSARGQGQKRDPSVRPKGSQSCSISEGIKTNLTIFSPNKDNYYNRKYYVLFSFVYNSKMKPTPLKSPTHTA